MSTTFSDPNYSVQSYLEHRPRYPPELYETILEFHKRPIDSHRSPETKLALDLGCGPGIATVELLPFFEKVIGVDDSEKMITMVKTKIPQAEFHVGSANFLPMIESGTVDLVTAATAAHWFPHDWWEEAGRVVKPGGTIAIWLYSQKKIIEPSHPKSNQLTHLLATLVTEMGMDTPGNTHAAQLYENLPLPTNGSQFTSFKKFFWNREASTDEKLFMSSRTTLETMRQQLNTYSPIYRWRAENPHQMGPQDDPVEKLIASLKNLTGWDESKEFVIGHPVCLIMMKRL